LVNIKKQGREQYCEARLEKLSKVFNWLTQHRQLWDARLNALTHYLNRSKSKNETYGNDKWNGGTFDQLAGYLAKIQK